MNKYLRIGFATALVLVLGATFTMAGNRDSFFVVTMPDVALGQIYNTNQIQTSPPNPQPSSLPAPQDPNDGDNSGFGPGAGVSKPGPTMFDGHGGLGSALKPNVGVRGGGMMTPKQQADRQIKRLINQLN